MYQKIIEAIKEELTEQKKSYDEVDENINELKAKLKETENSALPIIKKYNQLADLLEKLEKENKEV